MSTGSVSHSHFEELCALAAVGQISPAEYAELSGHLRDCPDCQQAYGEFIRLTHSDLPLEMAASRPREMPPCTVSEFFAKNHKTRFVREARARGLDIADVEPATLGIGSRMSGLLAPVFSWQGASIAVILGMCFFAGSWFLRWKQAESEAAGLAARVAALSDRAFELEKQLRATPQKVAASEPSRPAIREDTEPRAAKSEDTSELTARFTARIQELETKVETDKLMLETARGDLASGNDRRLHAEEVLRDAQQKLMALTQQVDDLRAARAQGGSALAAEQMQVADLSRRLKDQEEVIEKQQRLLSVDSDVRNVMAARNLHITDVFDVDSKGKKKPVFGRVFYTEGRSLVFYAFDLDAPKRLNAEHSFQAWAQLADGSSAAVNLGIFYVDDASQRRWRLTFDNPEVLKRINAVFVTAEPGRGTARPTGQKLMYAYLAHAPNHP